MAKRKRAAISDIARLDCSNGTWFEIDYYDTDDVYILNHFDGLGGRIVEIGRYNTEQEAIDRAEYLADDWGGFTVERVGRGSKVSRRDFIAGYMAAQRDAGRKVAHSLDEFEVKYHEYEKYYEKNLGGSYLVVWEGDWMLFERPFEWYVEHYDWGNGFGFSVYLQDECLDYGYVDGGAQEAVDDFYSQHQHAANRAARRKSASYYVYTEDGVLDGGV